MFLLALSPILWLVVALSVIKMAPWKACVLALIISLAAGIGFWEMENARAVEAVLEGLALACWPILLVIIAAIFTYNLTLETKAMDTIKELLTSVSHDKRVLILLIGWGFGGCTCRNVGRYRNQSYSVSFGMFNRKFSSDGLRLNRNTACHIGERHRN